MNRKTVRRTRRHARRAMLGAFTGLALLAASPAPAQVQPEATPRVDDRPDHVLVRMPKYTLRIHKQGLRFQLESPDGEMLAPAHGESGLQLARSGQPLASTSVTRVDSSDGRRLELDARTESGLAAVVTVEPADGHLRLAVTPESDDRYDIVLRTGGIAPSFGLADHAAFEVFPPDESVGDRRTSTELTGYVNDEFRAGAGPGGGSIRLVSNFVVFPKQRLAAVNIEPRTKVVRLTEDESAHGSRGVRELPALYYFVGSPEEIYRSFLEARAAHGYAVHQPKYEWFGVGWEAFGALSWETNQSTVTENVEHYLELGFPLRWMVVGSGFWPRHDENLHATTSFGMWDANLYPEPRRLIDRFRSRGLKFFIGLRIGFLPEGPFAGEGVERAFFLGENGQAKPYPIAFPRPLAYLIDSWNPAAVDWYVGLAGKWMDYGIDGFKEDLYGHGPLALPDDLLNPVNRALMERGAYVMGRNVYLGSPVDVHRFNDFNFPETQDRGPINGLAYAYSGFPYVYPDIVGGEFTKTGVSGEELQDDDRVKQYYMRYAQYASVNPSMSMGFGPWNFDDPQLLQVTLDAARLHDRLHPYIYSAALDAHRTGFPYNMTPLPLAYPDDPNVYELENTTRRGYQWLVGESLLATPLYGDDYATAESRDVYLPAGTWIDYDTGELYHGPRTLEDFPLPVGKTPLFVGGKGIVVEQRDETLEAHVYPIQTHTSMTFHHPDKTQSTIALEMDRWDWDQVAVQTSEGQAVPARREAHALVFQIQPGTDYEIGLNEEADGDDGVDRPVVLFLSNISHARLRSLNELILRDRLRWCAC